MLGGVEEGWRGRRGRTGIKVFVVGFVLDLWDLVVDLIIGVEMERLKGVEEEVSHVFVHVSVDHAPVKVVDHTTTVHHLYSVHQTTILCTSPYAYQIFRARPVVCLLFKPIRGIGRKARIPCFTPKKTNKKRLNLDFLLKWEKSDGRFSCAEERNIYFFLLNISSTLRSHNIVFNKGDSSAVVSFFQKFV